MLASIHRCRLLAGCAILAAVAAHAETAPDAAQDRIHISGNIRLYSFSRNYVDSTMTDLRSTSLGGKLKIETTGDGFGAALAGYFAQDIGLNDHSQNGKTINPLLMGTGYGIYVPGEAYVQYKTRAFLGRVGNQRIDTPWINPSDGFMIPNLYRGGVVSYTPFEGLQIEGDRVLQFKNRTAVGFDRNTLFLLPYDNPHFAGETTGAADVGVSYKSESLRAQTWLYRFYDYAQMAYVEGGLRHPGFGLVPFVNLQYMRETGDGARLLGAVDSRAYGAKAGLALPDKTGEVYLAYNKVPVQFAAGISNGNLLSPYTQVYNTDPLYTTVMNYGLVSARAAGYAWQVGTNLKLLEEKLDAVLSYSRYMTGPYAENVNALMVDFAYHLGGSLKGLTIRDRLGYERGKASWGTYYLDNRVMVQYSF